MEKIIVFFFFISCAVICTNTAPNSNQIIIGDDLIQSIIAAGKTIGLYNKELDTSIPWDLLNKTILAMGYGSQEYSEEASRYINPIQVALLNALHKYFEASQLVFEWTVRASSNLRVYLQAREAKGLLIDTLNAGVIKLSQSINKLDEVASEFDKAYHGITSMMGQLKSDFGFTDQDRLYLIQNFYNISKERVLSAKGNTTATREAIRELKSETESTRNIVFYIPDEKCQLIAESVNKLITQCEEYRRRHGGKN